MTSTNEWGEGEYKMPKPTPFFERTSKLCESMRWKDWAGYYTVCSFDSTHDTEYFAIRHKTALIDVTPLYKYEVYGRDAAKFLSRVMVKNIEKLKLNQVTYLCWCDDDGKIMDDGTVTRLSEDYFRVTAAEPTLHWLEKHSRRYQLKIEDSTERFGALAVQGPTSRDALKAVCDADLDSLKFFRSTPAKFDGFEGTITRTGYTGDLGFEVWVENKDATKLWDALIVDGRPFGTEPCGLDAMDVSRIEAGFIMNGVDYFSANHVWTEARKSTPYEIGLGWTVQLKRDSFIGQDALIREKEKGPKRVVRTLDINWEELEAAYDEHGLPPEVCTAPWRTPIPIYDFTGRQIGRATSGTWSPVLKKNIALASLEAASAEIGSQVKFEITVEYQRRTVSARVCENMLFNPERKRSTPNG